MFNSIAHSRKWPALVIGSLLTLSFGSVGNAAAAATSPCQNRPVIKNLTSLKTQVDCHRTVSSTSGNRLSLARSYEAKAETLDAQAAAYEDAAARLSNGPFVKNLMAPTTPARYSFYAKRLREEARVNRKIAASLIPRTARAGDATAE